MKDGQRIGALLQMPQGRQQCGRDQPYAADPDDDADHMQRACHRQMFHARDAIVVAWAGICASAKCVTPPLLSWRREKRGAYAGSIE
jgi:hypothetical protein